MLQGCNTAGEITESTKKKIVFTIGVLKHLLDLWRNEGRICSRKGRSQQTGNSVDTHHLD